MVLIESQRSRPRIEELHGTGTRDGLRAKEGACGLGHPGKQCVPGLRFLAHQCLGVQVVAGRSTLHEVGGQRERGPGESDERHGPEFGNKDADGFDDRSECRRVQLWEIPDLLCSADRLSHDGPHTSDDVDVDSGQLQGNDDVTEEDGRIDLVAAHWLECDLSHHVRPQAGVEHGRAFTQRPVLRQGPARLAHHPDRPCWGAAASVCADQRRIGGRPTDERVLRRQGIR